MPGWTPFICAFRTLTAGAETLYMVGSMYKWDILLKNLDFLGTFGHTEALPPLNVLVFFFKIGWSEISTKTALFPPTSMGGGGRSRARKWEFRKIKVFVSWGNHQRPERNWRNTGRCTQMRVESSARLMGRGAGNMPKTCKKGKFLLKSWFS